MNLSVARRELRLAAHSARFYRVRAGMATAGLIGMVCAFLGLDELESRSPFLLGQALFALFAWIVFVIAAGAFGATADSVSSEKRAGTLGLLFLTHLKGPDVILGKLVAHTGRFFINIVVLFPLLATPVLLGGLSSAQVFRLFISVANMMFLSAAAGMVASTFCVREQVAQSKALQIVLLFAAISPLSAASIRYFGGNPSLSFALDLLSPVYTQRAALGSLVGPQSSWFYISAGLVFLTSCALLAIAAWFVPSSWQDARTKTWLVRIAERLPASKRILARSNQGAALLDQNPFVWLLIRDPSTRRTLWLSIIFAIVLVGLLDRVLNAYWPLSGIALWDSAALLFHLFAIFKIVLGQLAANHIAEAKENGILEAILASRLSVEQMVNAQFRAAIALLGWPLLGLAILSVAAFLYSIPAIDRLADTFTTPPEINAYRLRVLFVLGIALAFLFVDAITLTWTGVLCGFRCSRPVKARSWTGFLVLAVPNVLYLVLVPTLLHFRSTRGCLESFYPPVLLWILVRLANDLLLIGYSRRWLRSAVRQTVSAPLESFRDSAFFPSLRALQQFLKGSPSSPN